MGISFRLAYRRLVRRPASFIAVSAVLAIGLTIAASLFAIVDGVLLKRLPFREPGQLFVVGVPSSSNPNIPSYARRGDYADIARAPGVMGVAGYVIRSGFFAAGPMEQEGLVEAKVTPGFFDLLGVRPWIGRPLLAADVMAGELRSVLIGYGLWRGRFGADEKIAGRIVTLAERRLVIAGVMPPGFDFPLGTNVWVPETLTPWLAQSTPETIVRFTRGVPQQLMASRPFVAERLDDYLRPRDWISGTVLFLATALTLVLAWVQLAAFQMGRAFEHGRELAVQAAVGASRRQIAAPWLIEAIAINGIAAAAAVALAPPAITAVVRLMPWELIVGRSIGADWRSLAFTCAMFAFGSAVVVLGPLLVVRDAKLGDALHGRLPALRHVTFTRVRSLMLAAQIGLVGLLLYAGGVAVHSFARVRGVDMGFDVARVMWVDLSGPQRSGGGADVDITRACEALEQIPSVVSALQAGEPFGEGLTNIAVGVDRPQNASDGTTAPVASVFSGRRKYFSTLGIPVLEGTVPEEPEPGGGVAVNQELARQLGLRPPAVGRHIWVGGSARPVVAVVTNVRTRGPGRNPLPFVYDTATRSRAEGVIIRTRSSPKQAAGEILARLSSLTGHRPARVRFGEDFYDRQLSGYRARSILLSLCGLASLVLGAVGVFGAAAQVARHRLKDTAIRLALGAERRAAAGQLLSRILGLAAIGLLLGVGAGAAAAKWMGSLLFGVQPFDPQVLAIVLVTVPSCGLLAALWPVRRLMRADIVSVLREE